MPDDFDTAFDELIAKGFVEPTGEIDAHGDPNYRLTPKATAALDRLPADHELGALLRMIAGKN